MSWLWIAIWLIVGYATTLPTWWPYRTHHLMRGVGLPAIVTLTAIIWPLWLMHRAFCWVCKQLDR